MCIPSQLSGGLGMERIHFGGGVTACVQVSPTNGDLSKRLRDDEPQGHPMGEGPDGSHDRGTVGT